MNSIISKAKDLLESNTVQVVIGYENGTNGNVRAAFITNPYHTDRLKYDNRCIQNLAIYLVKNEIKKMGRIAIVANLSVMRTIMMLISENQVAEKDIEVIGITTEGQMIEFADWCLMEEYIAKADLSNPPEDKIALEKLNNMNLQQRWDYWQDELQRCFKCYACRAVCPMCYCSRCTVECNQPQWIPVPAHPVGNLDWHILRTMHLVGRCISCGECGRACPLGIPVHLMTMQMADETFNMFGIRAGTSRVMPSLLSTFKPEDKENFIL